MNPTPVPENILLPGPDHRDLYLVIAGILLGVLLGPAVLGRVSPATYDKLFVGAAAIQEERQALDTQLQRDIQRLAATGVSETAIQEKIQAAQAKQGEFQKQIEQAREGRAGRAAGIVVVLLIVMILETLVDPRNLWLRARLATARYGLIAIWLALLLAQPALIRALPLPFIALLTAIALVVALVPLGKRNAEPHA
jgi:hypothetical protein